MWIETLEGRHNSKYSRMRIAVAVIAGGASLLGGVASAVGSSVAAGDQSSAATNAANLQQQQYQQNLANQQPYMTSGTNALNTINSDQANGTGFATPFNLASFTSNPGYQFQLQQGQNAINSSAAATGGTLNGGTLKALDQYTTGLANTTYGDAYNRYLANSQQQYGQLFNVAQLGENATATVGNQGTQAANASGNYLTQAGNANAAGTVGVTNAVNSGLGGIANGINTASILQGLQSQSGYGNVNPNNSAVNNGISTAMFGGS